MLQEKEKALRMLTIAVLRRGLQQARPADMPELEAFPKERGPSVSHVLLPLLSLFLTKCGYSL